MNRHIARILGLLLAAACWVSPTAAAGLPNPFYALDNSLRRPGLTADQQYDLLKELGYAGLAWHEEPPEQVKAAVAELEKRGLKMFAIYCPAKVTTEGDLTHSPILPELVRYSIFLSPCGDLLS